MAQLPVFKSSGNLSNDLKQVQVANILGLGFWKGQIISRSKEAVGHPSFGGHAVVPNIRIDGEMKLNTAYGQKVRKFLEIIGMDDNAIKEINGIWNQNRVDGITLLWRERVENNAQTFKIFFDIMKDSMPRIDKLEVRYTNLHIYPTTVPEIDRTAYEEIHLTSTLLSSATNGFNQSISDNDLMETGSIKAFDELGVEIPLTSDYQLALKGLMIVDGLNVMDTSTTTKEGEVAVYDNDPVLPSIIGYRPNALVTYEGIGIQVPSDAQIDSYVDDFKVVQEEDSEYVVQNFASTFWNITDTTSEATFWYRQTNTFNKFTRRFFSIVGQEIRPRVDKIRTATGEELAYIMSNYIEIDVHTESKWYDGVVKFVGGIVRGISGIFRFLDEILQKIAPVFHFITVTLFNRLVAGIARMLGYDISADDVHDFILDNALTIILTVYTFGSYGAVAGTISSIASSIGSMVWWLSTQIVTALGTILSKAILTFFYYASVALEYLVMGAVSSVTTVQGILQQLVSVGTDVAVQMKDAKEQREFLEKLAELEELQAELDREEQERKATFNIEQDMQTMYTDDFDMLGKLLIPNQFENGQMFDMQIK